MPPPATPEDHGGKSPVGDEEGEKAGGAEEGIQDVGGGDEAEKEDTHHHGPKGESLRNQFNFSERAAQTANNPFRVSCTDDQQWAEIS